MTNCTFIGRNAGMDVIEGEGLVIIGDEIRDIKTDQPHINIDDKLIVGEILFGQKLNLKELLENQLAGQVSL